MMNDESQRLKPAEENVDPIPSSDRCVTRALRWDPKPDKRIRGTFLRHERHTERLSMPRCVRPRTHSHKLEP